MAGLGAPELLIILVIILLVFGGAKLPKLARSLGQAQKEFKEGTNDANRRDDPSDHNKADTPRNDVPGDRPVS